MPPRARGIIEEIAAQRGLDPRQIVTPGRKQKVHRARAEVAILLSQCGFSSPQIGRMINHDHTTVLYYLGRGKKRMRPPVWKTPKVRTLQVIRPDKPPKPTRKYLTPYAGADWREYQWKEMRS
jgi:hypothetical protein